MQRVFLGTAMQNKQTNKQTFLSEAGQAPDNGWPCPFIYVQASFLPFVITSHDIHSVTLSFNTATMSTANAMLKCGTSGQSCMMQGQQALECVEEMVEVVV